MRNGKNILRLQADEEDVYHLMDLDPEEICGLFPVERLDWRTYEKREIV